MRLLRFAIICALAGTLAFGSVAFGAPDAAGKKPAAAKRAGAKKAGAKKAGAKKAGAKKADLFDFEGDVIETEFLRPNSAIVETVRKRAGLSLVRIKTSFLDKILATVDEL